MENSKPNDKIKLQGNFEGTDFSQYFESLNSKALKVGTSVIFIGDKIRQAKKGEVPCGIISAGNGIITGNYDEWPEKYLKTNLGDIIIEKNQVEILLISTLCLWCVVCIGKVTSHCRQCYNQSH